VPQIKKKTASVVASNPECKRLAGKAFVSYFRSVALMPHKEVFDVAALPKDEFAESLGLIKPPSLKVRPRPHDSYCDPGRGRQHGILGVGKGPGSRQLAPGGSECDGRSGGG
jgi:hypothetical protein